MYISYLLYWQEEYVEDNGGVNQWIEKQDKEIRESEDENKNIELPTNIAKTEIIENAEIIAADETSLPEINNKNAERVIKNIQTATEFQVEKNESFSPADKIPLQQYRIFIHSSWLAVQSSYFRALFYSSGMKESLSEEIILKVTEEELEAHHILIQAMYQPSILDDMDPYTVLQVLVLANKYDINLIFKKCKYVLMSVAMSLELCESVLAVLNAMVIADDFNESLERFLVGAFEPLDNFWLTDDFKNLSEDSLKLLLSSNRLVVLSENTVFVALMSWCEYNDYNGPSLLPLLRPELMTVEFLHEVVHNHYLAKQMDGFNKLLTRGLSCKRRALLESEITRRAEYKEDNEPTFMWQLHILGDNQHNSPEVYKSNHFWWCGFEMMLSLTLKSNLWNICLYVLNIEDASSLNFVWVIEAGLSPVIRRQVTFRNRLDLGYDKTSFSQPVQRNTIHCIKIFIRFAISSSRNPVVSCDTSTSDDSD